MKRFASIALIGACFCGAAFPAAPASPTSSGRLKPDVFEATLEQGGQKTPEISTAELKGILAESKGLVLDARPKQEFEVAHIPGSINIEARGLLRIVQAYPDRATPIVIYSNGPFCELAKLRSDEFLSLGYSRVVRYQLGMAVWRALGNTSETSLEGFRRIFTANGAAIVDARSRADYAAGTIPAAESILPGEVSRARKDFRLRFYDHGIRIIVFGNNAREARTVAAEIALNSYPNSSYFGGTYEELKRAKFFSERKPSLSNLDGLTR